jgi:lysophospholipase L1-like esterase
MSSLQDAPSDCSSVISMHYNKVMTILMPLASVFITALLIEIVLRMTYVPPPKVMQGPDLRNGEYYQSDQLLGWRPRPNVQGVHDIPGLFSSTFRTNRQGLRGVREFPFERGKAARMVVVGDSFTWGYGVNDEDVYVSKLAELLPKVEIINLGVTAYGPSQELEYFKSEGVRYRPDIVVLSFCLNDIEEYEYKSIKNGMSAGQDLAMYGRSSGNLKRWVSERVYLYSFIMDRINTSKALVNLLVRLGIKGELGGYEALDINLRPSLKQYPIELEEQWESTKSKLRMIRDIAHDQKARLVLVLIPSRQSIEPTSFAHTIAYTRYEPNDFDLDKPYRLLEQFALDEQIEVINPVAAFVRANEGGNKLYLANDSHFTPAGHELFAKEITTYLQTHPSSAVSLK